jgi:hypothetical protein
MHKPAACIQKNTSLSPPQLFISISFFSFYYAIDYVITLFNPVGVDVEIMPLCPWATPMVTQSEPRWGSLRKLNFINFCYFFTPSKLRSNKSFAFPLCLSGFVAIKILRSKITLPPFAKKQAKKSKRR